MKNSVLFILLYAGWMLAAAQPSVFRFGHVTNKSGLSQSLAYNIIQDRYGYLWVATQDGLNRFDGHQFKVFKNNPFDSTSLTHNWVWTVQEDRHGDLWVGSFQGLCKYVRRDERFIQYFHRIDDTTSVSGNRPNVILRDKKDRIWISSWGRGLNLYDEATNSFRRFSYDQNDDTSLSDNYIRSLFCDSEGTIWIGTWNGGLNRMIEDEKGIRFQKFNQPRSYGMEGGNRITSIAEDHSGLLWIASYESGIIQFDRNKNIFKQVPGFISDDVNKIHCDRQGNIWVGTNNGLHYKDAGSASFKHYAHDPQNPESISSNIIYAIAEDRSGMIWISGNGLDFFDPRRNIFQTYRSQMNNPNSLSQNVVWCFAEDDEGRIIIGTESGPLSLFDPKTRSFERLTITGRNGNAAANIHRIVYHKGILWLASFNIGLIRYDCRTRDTRFYFGTHESALGKVADVDEVLLDGDSTLWVSSNDNGLFRLNLQTDEVAHYKHNPSDPQSIGTNFLNALYKDKKGDLWIGFWGGGMSRLDKRTGNFTNYTYDRKNRNGLSDQVVSAIFQENDSIYWITTHSGLNKLNVYTNRFTHFFEADGFPSNALYDIQMDDNGYLWISSNGGVSKFDPRTYNIRTYTEDDGLQSNEFNANASFRSSTGHLYFGGVNGFSFFHPSDIKEDTSKLEVLIQQFKVYDQVFAPRQNVYLGYNQNYVAIQFAAPEFSAPDKVKYAFMLQNFDKDWIAATNRHEAIYTNLDPGNYVFRVKAANADGHWSKVETQMKIFIHPPFWRTWWFITFSVMLLIGFAYSIHRYRLMQSLKVERLRNKIASDLHDEVGSSLTRISIYSDLLQNGTEEKDKTHYLKNISSISREVVGTMSDIVWSIDNRHDSFGALIMRMKDFASEVLPSRNMELEFSVTGINEAQVLDPVLKQNLYLIFKEAINNIVKHSGASIVQVNLTNTEDKFIMRICDNGKGFLCSGQQKGNGLRNMERRAKAIDGYWKLESSKGTTLIVTRNTI